MRKYIHHVISAYACTPDMWSGALSGQTRLAIRRIHLDAAHEVRSSEGIGPADLGSLVNRLAPLQNRITQALDEI